MTTAASVAAARDAARRAEAQAPPALSEPSSATQSDAGTGLTQEEYDALKRQGVDRVVMGDANVKRYAQLILAAEQRVSVMQADMRLMTIRERRATQEKIRRDEQRIQDYRDRLTTPGAAQEQRARTLDELGKTPQAAAPVAKASSYDVAVGDKTYRVPATKAGQQWAEQRFGVSFSLKAGQYQLAGEAGERYVARTEQVFGSPVAVGVREVPRSGVSPVLQQKPQDRVGFDSQGLGRPPTLTGVQLENVAGIKPEREEGPWEVVRQPGIFKAGKESRGITVTLPTRQQAYFLQKAAPETFGTLGKDPAPYQVNYREERDLPSGVTRSIVQPVKSVLSRGDAFTTRGGPDPVYEGALKPALQAVEKVGKRAEAETKREARQDWAFGMGTPERLRDAPAQIGRNVWTLAGRGAQYAQGGADYLFEKPVTTAAIAGVGVGVGWAAAPIATSAAAGSVTAATVAYGFKGVGAVSIGYLGAEQLDLIAKDRSYEAGRKAAPVAAFIAGGLASTKMAVKSSAGSQPVQTGVTKKPVVDVKFSSSQARTIKASDRAVQLLKAIFPADRKGRIGLRSAKARAGKVRQAKTGAPLNPKAAAKARMPRYEAQEVKGDLYLRQLGKGAQKTDLRFEVKRISETGSKAVQTRTPYGRVTVEPTGRVSNKELPKMLQTKVEGKALGKLKEVAVYDKSFPRPTQTSPQTYVLRSDASLQRVPTGKKAFRPVGQAADTRRVPSEAVELAVGRPGTSKPYAQPVKQNFIAKPTTAPQEGQLLSSLRSEPGTRASKAAKQVVKNTFVKSDPPGYTFRYKGRLYKMTYDGVEGTGPAPKGWTPEAVAKGGYRPGQREKIMSRLEALRAERDLQVRSQLPAPRQPTTPTVQQATVKELQIKERPYQPVESVVQTPKLEGSTARKTFLTGIIFPSTAPDEALRDYQLFSPDTRYGFRNKSIAEPAVVQDQTVMEAQAYDYKPISTSIFTQPTRLASGDRSTTTTTRTPRAPTPTPPSPPTPPPPTNTTRIRTTPTTPTITPSIPPPKIRIRSSGLPAGRFEAQVRRRGVFRTIGVFGAKSEALSAAQDRVRNTAAASFKVVQDGRPSESIFSGFDFRPSKREPGVFVEKERYRITTPGEKAEIRPRPKGGVFGKKMRSVFGGKR